MFYLTDAAIILLTAFALILISWWCGHPRRTLLENTALGAGAMLGIAGTLLAAWGHFFSISSTLWPLLLSVIVFLALPTGVPYFQRTAALQKAFSRASQGLRSFKPLEWGLLLYFLATFALTLALSLAPPGGNDYDSLVYHLSVPQKYLQAGRVVELPYDHHSYFPFLTEMLFAWGLAAKGPVLAKLAHWLMLPLGCLALWAFGQRHFSHRVGLLAAALYATIPLVQIEATTAYVDLSLTAFVLLAFLAFSNWLQTSEGRWLAWAGVFSGFAMGTKYSGALFLGWLMLWAMSQLIRAKGTERPAIFKPMLCALVWAALLGGGWLLRNILWTGNPVYPFVYELFGGKGWTLQMAKDYSADQVVYGYGKTPLDILLLPLRLAWAPLNFSQPFWPLSHESIPSGGSAGRFEVLAQIAQSFIGPPLIAFGLPLVFTKRKPAVIGFLLWTTFAFLAFWAITSQQIRYLLPTLALLCLCCAWGIEQFSTRSPILKYSCAIMLAGWLLFVPVHTLHRLGYVLPVVLGSETPQAFLLRSAPGYAAMQWANQNTPKNASFAIYGEPRDFYLERNYFWADDGHNNLVDYSQIKSGADLAAALKKLGATHVLANRRAAQNGGFGEPPALLSEGVAQGNFKLLFEQRGYEVYAIS